MNNNSNLNRVLVIIINYKTPLLTIDALKSLENEIDFATDQVVVVDNASQDNSVNDITTALTDNNWNHWVTLIESDENGGFSAGNNIGIKAFNAEYYLLLNSDAYIYPGAITALLNTISANKNIGMVGPQIEWPDGEIQVSRFNNMTVFNQFISVASTGFLTNFFALFGVKEIPIPTQTINYNPDWLSFACVLIRNTLIADIGYLDDGYFMYREDNDYCRRARDKNWQLQFVPESRMVHLNKGLSNECIKRLPSFYYESRSRYFQKYYGKLGLLVANILWSLGRFVLFLRMLTSNKKTKIHPLTIIDIWQGFLK